MKRGYNDTKRGPVIVGSHRRKLGLLNPDLPELGWAKVKLGKRTR